MGGVEAALNEITLVFFTTLAPTGVVAFMLMCLPSLAGRAIGEERVRLDRLTYIPIVVALVGLVASATHLGNPANALYVVLGVGRSPLSNEVVCGVVFFGLAGAYWLTSFSEHSRPRLRRAALVPLMVAGVLFVTAIALAYDADTILTWHSPYVPATLWMNALVGGPLLAVLGLCAAKSPQASGGFGRALVIVSALAWVASVALYVLQGLALGGIENHMTSAAALVPGFMVFVAAYAVLSLAGVAGMAAMVRGRMHATVACMAAFTAVALIAIFIMRFAFYMMHLTVGLGV